MKTIAPTPAKHKKKSMQISLLIHGMLIAAMMIPVLQKVTPEITRYVVPVAFSSMDHLQTQEHNPASHKQTDAREKVRLAAQISKTEAGVVQSEHTRALRIKETPDTRANPVPEVVETASVTPVDPGGIAEHAMGDVSGNAYDGILTRKITSRKDISRAAHASGMIVVDVCIDRRGKVLTARNNAAGTTINDMEMVREVLLIASAYRFEIDYTAAQRECGSLTFIFDLYGNLDESGLLVFQ